MQESLPIMSEPEWLSRVSAATVGKSHFPLHDLLCDSLYYPSSGFDGDPVRHLAGNVLSFVYVDYGHRREELDAALASPGFSGYEIMARRDVTEQELTPCGWTPSFRASADGDPSQFIRIQEPFCTWIVMQRSDGIPSTHGPTRFSLLYLCADGCAAFQALYVANGAFPQFVAVIQPGHLPFGNNWINLEDQNQIFARSVINNPAGVPEFLLYGGIGRRNLYRRPCWEIYGENICFFEKAGGGSIGIWRKSQK